MCSSDLIAGSSVTVYALWGVDTDGNGLPDILETKYSLTYDLNGGIAGTGPIPNPVTTMVNGTHFLSGAIPTHAQVGGVRVVFIGWTAQQDATIYTMNDTAPTTITQVTILGANEIVHAVWGYDENGDGTADVRETKYSLTYDLNGGTAGTGPIPNPVTTLVNGTYTLSTTAPTHAQVGGVDVVLVGWAAAPDPTIYLRNDPIPATISNVTISGANEIVYAVWGFDENSDGVADVLEPRVRRPGTGFGNATIIPFGGGGGAQPDAQNDPNRSSQNDSAPSGSGIKDEDEPASKVGWGTYAAVIILVLVDVLLFAYRRVNGDKKA